MKITVKMAVLALAVAVVFASCSNSFSGTAQDQAAVTAAFAKSDNAAKVSLNTPTVTASLTPATAQTMTLSFTASDKIDVATITSAITIRHLASGATANDPYVQGAAVAYTVTEVRDSVAYIALGDLTGSTAWLEMFIDSTKLTGQNGSLKLNLDGDRVMGESGDDDYYAYIPVTGGTAITGVQRNPRAGMNIAGFTFAPTYDSFTFTYGRQGGLDTADYKTLFDSCLVIEKYAPAGNSWTTITPTSTTYVTTSGLYTSNFAAAIAADNLRVRFVNLQNFKTTAAFYGYVQRATMDSTVSTSVMPTITSVPDATQIPTGTQGSVFSRGTYKDANGLNVEIRLTFSVASLSVVGDKGMDTSSFTADNVKIYDTANSVWVPFNSATFRYPEGTSVAAQTGPKNEVVLVLDPAIKSDGTHTYVLYVGPGLKTLGDATPGTAARRFGDFTAIDNQPRGFLSIPGGTF